jgi:hypothetical protein
MTTNENIAVLDLKIAAAHINDCDKEMKIQRRLKAI